jgi:hypothetical protein
MNDESAAAFNQWLRDVETVKAATGKWISWVTFEGGTRKERAAELARQQSIRDEALRIRADEENLRILYGDPLAIYGDFPPHPMFLPQPGNSDD